MSDIRYWYCPECYQKYDSRTSDGDLSDCCRVPLDNCYPESYYTDEED